MDVVGEPYVFGLRSGKVVGRFYFVVEVDGVEVKLDENEHQNYVWLTEDEVKEGRSEKGDMEITTKEVRQIILKGFEMVRKR